MAQDKESKSQKSSAGNHALDSAAPGAARHDAQPTGSPAPADAAAPAHQSAPAGPPTAAPPPGWGPQSWGPARQLAQGPAFGSGHNGFQNQPVAGGWARPWWASRWQQAGAEGPAAGQAQSAVPPGGAV